MTNILATIAFSIKLGERHLDNSAAHLFKNGEEFYIDHSQNDVIAPKQDKNEDYNCVLRYSLIGGYYLVKGTLFGLSGLFSVATAISNIPDVIVVTPIIKAVKGASNGCIKLTKCCINNFKTVDNDNKENNNENSPQSNEDKSSDETANTMEHMLELRSHISNHISNQNEKPLSNLKQDVNNLKINLTPINEEIFNDDNLNTPLTPIKNDDDDEGLVVFIEYDDGKKSDDDKNLISPSVSPVGNDMTLIDEINPQNISDLQNIDLIKDNINNIEITNNTLNNTPSIADIPSDDIIKIVYNNSNKNDDDTPIDDIEIIYDDKSLNVTTNVTTLGEDNDRAI